MKKNKLKIPKDLQLEIFNKKQKWYAVIRDNCTATIKQFEDSIKLQKDILEMSKQKIIELA